ncbi:MAG: hypothetical protein FD123_689 [Bacteroidetes bacterium]|nr:MAG: hypothetical protein FD123_689 [Bacteroidota bacterium]
MDLWKRFLAKADSVLGNPNSPQFIVYTGDLPAHYACGEGCAGCYLAPGDRASHDQDLTVILTGLRNLANKYKKPLFYMPGNNDALAGDYFSFADSLQKTPFSLVPDSSNPFPALNINRGSTQAPCMVSNPHPQMGYYSARPVEGLRLLALNTVIYNTCFTTVDGSQQGTDGDTQMAWIAAQLAEAKAQNEKVYIAMHIPPGKDAYSGKSMWAELPGQGQSWLNTFLSLTDSYQATIAGILYGHTHMDEVRRLYNSAGKITEVAVCCPGVTPQHYNNPGFKTVEYDAASKELMDFTTYHTTLNIPAWGNRTYTFSKYYQSPAKTSIFQRLSSMSLPDITSAMDCTYTVRNGPAPARDSIAHGIEVMWQK